MKSHVSAIRAVTAEFAGQFIRPFIWIALGLILTLLAVVGLLAFLISEWWLLLLVPIILISLVGLVAWLIVRFILKTLSPRLNAQQKSATKEFVNHLEQTIEAAQTPYPVIIFFIIRDILLKRDAGYVSRITEQSSALKPEFKKLSSLF